MPTTLTITRNIVNINPAGSNVWRIEFNPNQTILTTQEVTYPVTYNSSSALPVNLNPFLNNLSNWNANNYNAIINNADFNRLSQWYKQIDYDTAQTIPVNFAQLISGSASPASVQDSNYTSYRVTTPRYLGSKNTTDNFNSPLTSQSLVVQNYQNNNIGATTLGYPSVSNYDTGIYEFAWGGGTYPEIGGGGAVKLSQILNVDSTSSVGIISPITNYFTSVIGTNLIPNSQPQFTQYTTTANIPNTARVMTTEFGVPTISSYMISSEVTSTTAGGSGAVITMAGGNLSNLVTTNSSGFYTTGSLYSLNSASFDISNSLDNGDRWFVTLYNDLPITVQGTLSPFNSGSTADYSIITENGYNDPIAYNGVFEILSVTASVASTCTWRVDKTLPLSTFSIGNGGYGMLIWKAITDGTFILFNGDTLSGVGKGNLITPTASPTIKNNLTYITQEYGTNPSNQ